jgi:hypothetical protein
MLLEMDRSSGKWSCSSAISSTSERLLVPVSVAGSAAPADGGTPPSMALLHVSETEFRQCE